MTISSIHVLFLTTFSCCVGIIIGFFIGKKNQLTYSLQRNKEMIPLNSKEERYINDTKGKQVHNIILSYLKELYEELAADFVAVAFYDVMTDEIRWRIAVGASNQRYQRIVIRLGKGIAGEAVQLNRTIKMENFPYDTKGNPIEYPILLVEHLKSAIAVPIADHLKVYGVLLVGQRSQKNFTDKDEKEMQRISKQIANHLEKANSYARIVDEKMNEQNFDKKVNINDMKLIQFLRSQEKQMQKNNRGVLKFEVLDQSILQIPNHMQISLIYNLQEIIQELNKFQDDYTMISIVREESDVLIECRSKRIVSQPRIAFEKVYDRMSEIGGTILSHQEDDAFYFVMQLPIWAIQYI